MDFGGDKNGRGSHSSDTFTETLGFIKEIGVIDPSAYRISTITPRLMHRTLSERRVAFAMSSERRADA